MPLLLRTLTATTLAGALLVCAGGGAHAERWWGRDAAHDATEWTWSPDPEPCGTLTERDVPREAVTDLVGLGVRHEAETIELRAALREVTPWRGTAVSFVLDTPGRSVGTYRVDVQRARPNAPLEAILFSYLLGEPDECGVTVGGGAGLPCDVEVRGPGASRVVTVVLPRSCVGTPRWVRAGVSTLRDERGSLRGDTWGAHDADSPYGPLGPRVSHRR